MMRIEKYFTKSLIVLSLATTMTLGTAVFASNQPNMDKAAEHIDQAIQALKAASHDKGGHRLKAIKLLEDAQLEVQKGIETEVKNISSSNTSAEWNRGCSDAKVGSYDRSKHSDEYETGWQACKK